MQRKHWFLLYFPLSILVSSSLTLSSRMRSKHESFFLSNLNASRLMIHLPQSDAASFSCSVFLSYFLLLFLRKLEILEILLQCSQPSFSSLIEMTFVTFQKTRWNSSYECSSWALNGNTSFLQWLENRLESISLCQSFSSSLCKYWRAPTRWHHCLAKLDV